MSNPGSHPIDPVVRWVKLDCAEVTELWVGLGVGRADDIASGALVGEDGANTLCGLSS